MPRSHLQRLRKLCLALPEAREVEAWGAPTFRVKTIFAMYAEPENHHGEGRESVWVKALRTNQELMVRAAPARFFVPPYVGPSGWIGVYLDGSETDWAELAELLHDAWRLSAPKKLVAALEAPQAADGRGAPTKAARAAKAAKAAKAAGRRSAVEKPRRSRAAGTPPRRRKGAEG